jgi:hypothetical protein
MQRNKYGASAVQKIIDNIEYMLEKECTAESVPINDCYYDEVRVVTLYTNKILPKLKALIEKWKIPDKKILE